MWKPCRPVPGKLSSEALATHRSDKLNRLRRQCVEDQHDLRCESAPNQNGANAAPESKPAAPIWPAPLWWSESVFCSLAHEADYGNSSDKVYGSTGAVN